jgi:RNA 2',3'-cyclic 3'-phosphodiesterase
MSRNAPRTFIAVPLEEKLRTRIVALQEELAGAGTDVKWVEPENLHVTLLFLGEVDLRESVEICRAVRRVTETISPFKLEPSGVGCFPNARRPRTLWAGAAEGHDELVHLHHAIEAELLELGGYRREERGYTPHITLGRIKTDDVTPELRTMIAGQADWSGGKQMVREVRVLTSELRSSGPTYTVLSREKLRGDGDEVE